MVYEVNFSLIWAAIRKRQREFLFSAANKRNAFGQAKLSETERGEWGGRWTVKC